MKYDINNLSAIGIRIKRPDYSSFADSGNVFFIIFRFMHQKWLPPCLLFTFYPHTGITHGLKMNPFFIFQRSGKQKDFQQIVAPVNLNRHDEGKVEPRQQMKPVLAGVAS